MAHEAPDFSRYERIKAHHEGRILVLSLSNPKLMNAVDELLHRELSTIFLKGPDPMEAKRIIFSLLDLEKPLIASVRGPAVGLGATIALMCDVIYASENAKFADPHVRVGIVAGDGGAIIWPQLCGYAKAKEYLMTGDPVPAAEAERIGLINHVVADEALDEAALSFAKRLAKGAIQAIKYTKVSVNIGLKQLAHSILDTSIAYEMNTFATDDHREAVRAFLEKRAPKFTGH